MKDLVAEASQVLEQAAKHRDAAISFGFSDEAAEAMGVSLHNVLLASLIEEGVDNPPGE